MAKYTEETVVASKSSKSNGKYKTVENEKGSYQLDTFTPDKGKNKGKVVPMLVVTDGRYPFKIGVRKAWAVRRAVKALRLFCADYPLEGKQKPQVPVGKMIKRNYGDEVGSYITSTYRKDEDSDSYAMWVADPEGNPVQFGVTKAHQLLEAISSVRAFCLDYQLEEAGDE